MIKKCTKLNCGFILWISYIQNLHQTGTHFIQTSCLTRFEVMIYAIVINSVFTPRFVQWNLRVQSTFDFAYAGCLNSSTSDVHFVSNCVQTCAKYIAIWVNPAILTQIDRIGISYYCSNLVCEENDWVTEVLAIYEQFWMEFTRLMDTRLFSDIILSKFGSFKLPIFW